MDKHNISKQLKPLPKNVRSAVRSGIAIANVAQCVEELVLNSIDAGATNIRISVDLDKFTVRVEDDGSGLSKDNLDLIGLRYNTNKCHDIQDLSVLKFYGYRGEALASIIDVSESVTFISRPKADNSHVYERKFVKGQSKGNVKQVSNSKKSSHGLDVVITHLLSRVPVRQKAIDKGIQLEQVKESVEHIALINPSVAIELLNESNGARLLQTTATDSIIRTFYQIYGSRALKHDNLLQEQHIQSSYLLSGYLSQETHPNKNFQFFFVNKRFISRCKLHRSFQEYVAQLVFPKKCRKNYDENRTHHDYPVFIVNIKCDLASYDITLEPKKSKIEFKHWEVVLAGLNALALQFKHTVEGLNKCVVSTFAKVQDGAKKKHHSFDEKMRSKNDLAQVETTTHDVKRAIHSRFAVRQSLPNTLLDSHSKISDVQTVSSGNAKSSRHSVSTFSSPKKLTTISQKRNTVDVRAIRKKRKTKEQLLKQFGNPRGGINKKLKAKPLLTANVFSRFSQWKHEPLQYKPSQRNDKASDAPSTKRRRLDHLSDDDEKITSSQLLMKNFQELSVTPGSRDNKGKRDEETSPPIASPDIRSWEWKMNRFVKDCHQQQKVLESELSKTKYKTAPSSVASMSEKSFPSTRHQSNVENNRTPAGASSAAASTSKQSLPQSGRRKKIRVPQNSCVEIVNRVIDTLTASVNKLPDRTTELKRALTDHLQNSEVGKSVLKSFLDDSPPVVQPSGLVGRPFQMERSDALPRSVHFSVPSTLPMQTPDPYGMKTAINTQTSHTIPPPLSSVQYELNILDNSASNISIPHSYPNPNYGYVSHTYIPPSRCSHRSSSSNSMELRPNSDPSFFPLPPSNPNPPYPSLYFSNPRNCISHHESQMGHFPSSAAMQMPPPMSRPVSVQSQKRYETVTQTNPEYFRNDNSTGIMELSPFADEIKQDDSFGVDKSPLMRALVIPPEMDDDNNTSPYFKSSFEEADSNNNNNNNLSSEISSNSINMSVSKVQSQDIGTSPIKFDELSSLNKSPKRKTVEEESSCYFSSAEIFVDELSPIPKSSEDEEKSLVAVAGAQNSHSVVAVEENFEIGSPAVNDGIVEKDFSEILIEDKEVTTTTSPKNKVCCVLPPLSDTLPAIVNRSRDSTWSDSMWRQVDESCELSIMNDSMEDSTDWGEDWSCDLVSDENGMDWLKTEDTKGKTLYINLSTGDPSYDMKTPIDLKALSASDAAKFNSKRFNWLRRYFPRTCTSFWNPNNDKRTVLRNGNMDLMESSKTMLGSVVKQCLEGEIEPTLCKWRDEDRDKTKVSSSQEKNVRISEYWRRPFGSTDEVPAVGKMGDVISFCQKNSCRFSKEDLNRVEVIAQLDKKFILGNMQLASSTCEEQYQHMLVAFDQHAVHERIRLEKLIAEAYVAVSDGLKEIAAVSINPPFVLNFSDTEIRIIQNYKDTFKSFGVAIEPVSSMEVKIMSAPKPFADKIASEVSTNRDNTMKKLLVSLFQEEVRNILDTKGVNGVNMPKVIFNVLCSQACHGAIKFGDELDLSVCRELVNSLKMCKAPFQCAHGRPSIVPLIDIQKLKENTSNSNNGAHDCSPDHYSQCLAEFSNSQKQRDNANGEFVEDKEEEISSKYFDDNSN